MANHPIQVTLIDPQGTRRVRALPNPLPDDPRITVRPGDTVTWTFDATVGGGELNVGFSVARNLAIQTQVQPVGPMGPFSTLTRAGDRIIGTIDEGAGQGAELWRYYYKISRNGAVFEWDNPAPQAPDKDNGGGIDTPRRPPT